MLPIFRPQYDRCALFDQLYQFTRTSAACARRYNVTRAHMVQLCEAIIALGYQFIVLDCPAGIDVGFINAISPAKEALIVTTPEITSIR